MSAMDRTSEDFSELLCSFEQHAGLRLFSLHDCRRIAVQ